MHTAAVILAIVLAIVSLSSGGIKLAGATQSLRIRDTLGVSARLWRIIGALEIAGAVGLLAGIGVPVLGIAAAVALALAMIGAVVVHGRAGDLRHAAPAVVVLVVAVATIVTQLKSV